MPAFLITSLFSPPLPLAPPDSRFCPLFDDCRGWCPDPIYGSRTHQRWISLLRYRVSSRRARLLCLCARATATFDSDRRPRSCTCPRKPATRRYLTCGLLAFVTVYYRIFLFERWEFAVMMLRCRAQLHGNFWLDGFNAFRLNNDVAFRAGLCVCACAAVREEHGYVCREKGGQDFSKNRK